MNRRSQTGPPRSGEVPPRRGCQRLERAVSKAGRDARLAQGPHCSHIQPHQPKLRGRRTRGGASKLEPISHVERVGTRQQIQEAVMKSLRLHRLAGILAVCGLLLIAVLAGCGGGGGTTTPLPAALKSIAISPSVANIPRGGTQPFTATGTFSDSSTKDITATCVWMSSNTAVVTISSSGFATAVSSAGIGQTANITCSQSGLARQ